MSESTPGVNVAARQRLDAADGFVAGVDVDAGLLVIHQKSSLPMSVCISCARRRALGRLPSRSRRTQREEVLLVEILLEHVEAFARAARSRRRDRARSRAPSASAACCAARPSPSASATGARVGSRDGMPTSNSAVDRRRVARRRQARRGRRPRRAAVPGSRCSASANFSVSIEEALVRLAVDAEQADRRGDRRLRRLAARSAAGRQRRRARACRRSSRAPAPHRPAAGRRAWRSR